jgi:hypothetical protein
VIVVDICFQRKGWGSAGDIDGGGDLRSRTGRLISCEIRQDKIISVGAVSWGSRLGREERLGLTDGGEFGRGSLQVAEVSDEEICRLEEIFAREKIRDEGGGLWPFIAGLSCRGG